MGPDNDTKTYLNSKELVRNTKTLMTPKDLLQTERQYQSPWTSLTI